MKILTAMFFAPLLAAPAFAQDSIRCDRGEYVKFDGPILQQPIGQVPVELKGFSLALGNTATLSRPTSFSPLQVNVGTAYCLYTFWVNVGPRASIKSAHVECEGDTQELRCEIP